MSYETARIAGRIGPLSMSGPAPARAVHVPTTEAAYAGAMLALARKEGHRRGMPSGDLGASYGQHAFPGRGVPPVIKVLRLLAARGAMTRREIGERARLYSDDCAYVVPQMLVAGLIREEPAPLPCHPHRVLLALTPAGRAKAEAAR